MPGPTQTEGRALGSIGIQRVSQAWPGAVSFNNNVEDKMHEASQTKEATETQETKKAPEGKRPYKYHVLVTHLQMDLEGKIPAQQFISFDDKAALRKGLDNPRYEGTHLRIIRGYEMNVKAKRQISIN